MTIAAVSQAAAARTGVAPPATDLARVAVATPASEVTRIEGAAAAQPQRQQDRRELVDAMAQTLAIERDGLETGPEQAVYRFTHALMQDLRAVGGNDDTPGRRDWNDLGSRLGTLASATAAQARPQFEVSNETPPLPHPVTVTSAAVHLMQVPSSRLVEAFIALRDAVPSLAEVTGGGGSDRSQLAAFLQRLVEAAPQSATPAGLLLHTRA